MHIKLNLICKEQFNEFSIETNDEQPSFHKESSSAELIDL